MWASRADAAQDVLLRRYLNRFVLNGVPGLFRAHSPAGVGRDRFKVNYWWQAHALDALVDAQLRAPSDRRLERMEGVVRGIKRVTRGRVVNEYYDDMAWMALATLRADQVGAETIELVRLLWNEIIGAWNPECGGGIPWRRSMPGYKNVPANGPTAILAARLHRRDGDAESLEWARRIVAWMQETLVDPETGIAWDGVNRLGDGAVDRDWLFTYNQGVVIGADVELSAITGDSEPRRRAERTAGAALRKLSVDGILPDEEGGDGGLFKGILARYLAELGGAEVAATLLRNGEAAWSSRDAAGRFGSSWTEPPKGGSDLSSQLSGVMLAEQLARLEARGEFAVLD